MADPLPVCYLNGEFLPLRDARISPLDRGFLFADSVYEVLPVFAGRMFRFREHFDRLARSLGEIGIPSPHTHAQWLTLLEELIRRNGEADMYVYVQVTRGMEFGRNHAFPERVSPAVFAMASPLPALTPELREKGLSAITVEDFRWGRCDIKTTALLANVLMKQQAAEAGAHEAIIIRNGEVLEGASSSVFVVLSGAIITPPNSRSILPGTTRDAALEIAEGVTPIQIRGLSLDELRAASEVWIAAATRDVVPVTTIDGRPVGEGKPGPVWLRMNALFSELRMRLAGTRAM
jgi:D-alanine transaminase